MMMLVTAVQSGGASKTHQSVFKISMNTGICQSSIGHIIHDLFRAIHPPNGKRCAYSVANVFLVTAAAEQR